MGVCLGCDPGLSGAIAVLGMGGELLEVHDVPRIEVAKGTRKNKQGVEVTKMSGEIEGYALARMLDDITTRYRVEGVWIEQVGAMHTDSTPGAFAFGVAYGVLLQAVRSHFVPLAVVSTQAWRKAVGVTAVRITKEDGTVDRARSKAATKTACRAKAISLWPAFSDAFARVCDSDRAESALIAEYGRRKLIAQERAA